MARDLQAERLIAPTSDFSALSVKRTDTELGLDGQGRGHRRFARRAALRAASTLVVASSFLPGCMSPRQGEPNTAPETKTETQATPDLGPQTPTSHKRQVPNLFELDDRTEFVFRTDMLPELPKRFSREELTARAIEVSPPDASEVIVFVDDHFRVDAQSGSFKVSELLWEDVELAPGPHSLNVLVVNDEAQLHVQSHIFFLEVEPRTGVEPPSCVLGTAKSTLNGPEEASELRLAVVPLSPKVERAVYEASGPGLRSRGEFPVGSAVILVKPPNGDIELSARCLAGDQELGTGHAVVTVNGDAPDGEGE